MHATLNNGDQSLHDANRNIKNDALRFFYPEYEGKESSPQAYVGEAIQTQQLLLIYADAIQSKHR